jgi:DnaJ-class molecular chaperone
MRYTEEDIEAAARAASAEYWSSVESLTTTSFQSWCNAVRAALEAVEALRCKMCDGRRTGYMPLLGRTLVDCPHCRGTGRVQ